MGIYFTINVENVISVLACENAFSGNEAQLNQAKATSLSGLRGTREKPMSDVKGLSLNHVQIIKSVRTLIMSVFSTGLACKYPVETV